jgi:hypothetical protein
MTKYLNCKLIVLIVLFFSLQKTQAQNNWDGDNPIGRFTNCNNWFADTCPAVWNSTTDLSIQLKNNGSQTTMYLDYGSWIDINNLTYSATYTSSVTQFDADGPVFNENGINFYGKIENYAPNLTQVFNLPFHGRNATVIELNPINGGLTFNRPIYNSGNKPFYVYGPNSRKVTLNNYPEGNGSVGFYLKEYSIVEVNYNNAASLSGGYFVEEGELWIESNGVIQGGIQVGNANANTNKLYISNPTTATTVANAVTVATNSTNATIGSLNTANTHTYSGAINLNNNAVNFDVVSATGTVDFTNTISGTGGIVKIGPGLTRLSASSTYTGNTVVNQGTLQYGAANAIANTSNVILNGGKLSTGDTVGYSDTVGTLALTDNSIIELGTGNNILTFAASNLVAWTAGRTLTITGWTNSCTGSKVFVGNSNTGLTAGQLAQITFQGYAPGASISVIGELIPGNVVLTATGGTLMANYATMKAAFDAINLGTHTGAIAISVLNDTNEGTATAALNNNAAVTSVSIQPAGCGPRTISGNTTAGLPLIDFNGADNVTVDGLNTNGNSLTITNTTVSATSGTSTIRFQTDATSNTITNCSILGSATMASGAAGGNIWFGAGSALTGNDNNTISNCNIGPAGVNLPSKGIYFSGNAPFFNDNILIDNNNIYDFFSATVASTGIDLGTIGSSNVSITNNRLYQTATRTQTTASIHSCIRIVNNAGLFTITGNTIGYSSSAGTGTYNFVGIANSIFNPITLSVGTATASSLQNNTIAGISHNTSSGGFTNLFNAILVSTGAINIGTTTGNTIGLATAPITFNATAGLGGIAVGITTTSVATVNIQNNIIQAISGTGVAGAAFDFTGINIAGTAASTYTVSNNTIGNAIAANSINLGVLGTSTGFSTFRGVNSAALGAVTIGSNGFPNLIQNITLNANATNAFIGISNTGANTATNIRYNNIREIRFASVGANASTFTGIINSGAVNGPLNITNNNLGILGTDLVTYSGACSGLFRGIINTGAGAAAALSIASNDIRGVSHVVAGSSNHTYISNTAACPTHSINLNSITGTSSTSGIVLGIDDSSTLANKSITNNTITALSSTGNIVTAVSSSNGTAVSIGTNTISNISSTSATPASIVSGISVTGGTNISITNNPITTLSSANNGSFRGIFVNPLGTTSINGNTINGMTSASTGAGFSVRGIEVQGAYNATISSNTISNINSATTNVTAGVGTPIVGLYYGSTGAASTITGNTISSLNATTAGAINVSVAAIVTANTTAGGTISKNRIYGLTNSKTGATANTIGFVPNGGNWTVANNMISITNNNTVQAIGVFDAGAAGARNYYYNSIYIGGTHAGTQVSNAFQFNNTGTGTTDIKNNIFVMARTSGAKNYAFANTGANFTGVTTNYNVLNCSVATTIGLTNATDRDFAAWKTASGGDTNSYSGILVSFVDTATADLHLTPSCTDIESGGTPLAILDDYDTTARNSTTPDIGADEFIGTKPADITLTPNSPLCLGSSITLNATSTDLTYVYTWSPATGLSATTGATVTANPIVTTTYTVTGTSPSSCVKIKDVTITLNPAPAPITVSPATVNMCANTVQMFTASPNTGSATVGVSSGNSVAANSPYRQGSTTEVRIQYLITKAELNAAGMAGGNITSLSFNVVAPLGNGTMSSYVITMANTSATALTATYIVLSSPTTVFSSSYLPVLGTNTHTFSTPFVWDGSSNVVINICHTGPTGLASVVSVSTPVVVSTNSNTGGGSCSLVTSSPPTPANAFTFRPVMTFTFENPITWSPVTELFTNAAATTVYNPGVHLNQPTIYAKPSIPRVYTATLTTVGTGCTRTSTGTITFSASVWDGATWTPPGIPTGNTSLSFTGSYTSSGNLSGCSCSVTGGDVVFNGPDALILTNSLTVTAPGTLKFNNNASLVQVNDSATNTGIITMERITPPIYRFDYTYWGTPVTLASNFTLGLPLPSNGLSPDTLADKFFSWTPTISNGMGNWFFESAATVMDPIKGYIVRGPQTYSFTSGTKIPYTANFIGTPNNGEILCPIFHGTLVAPDYTDDWNLLGNPYPSAVSALSFLSHPTNTPIIDGTIYFWTHNSAISTMYPDPFYGDYVLNYNDNDYASWNRVGSVGTAAGTGGPIPGGFIAAGQGFFTKSTGTAPSGNSVIFNNSMRVAGSNSQFFRMASTPNVVQEDYNDTTEKQRIWLNMINNSGSFNQILVGYVEGATLGIDRDFDGVRFTDNTSTTFYSTIEDTKLVIQARPLPFIETDEVPLGYRSNIQDTFSLRIDHIDSAFENQNIYLEDRDLNIIHNLKLSPYTFTTGVGTFNSRFVLRYTDSALSNEVFDSNQDVIAFISSNELQIRSTENIVSIYLYDIAGKFIKAYTPKELSLGFKTNFNFAKGVYLTKIKLDNGMEVTKKVIH